MPAGLATAAEQPAKSTLSITRVPPVGGLLPLPKAVSTPVWVLVKVVSWRSTEPTVWLRPPLAMSTPTPQLLIERDFKVHSQFQFMKMAVLQLLKVMLRVVNCWLPRKAP